MDDDDALYCLQKFCEPVFQHFMNEQRGTFLLDCSHQSDHRRRMIDVYVQYTLRDLLHGYNSVRTDWLAAKTLVVNVH
ncbi:hypothetical protein PS3A_61180 [Pseudomonas sp. 3A(2025)]